MAKKLIVNGNVNNGIATAPAFDSFANFDLSKSVQVSSNRSIANRQELLIDSEHDVVELQFEDNSTWIGNAQEFQEIFDLTDKRSMDDDEDTLEIPLSLSVANERGVLQDVAVSVFNLFKRKTGAIVHFAVHEIATKLEDKVQPQPGLFYLDYNFRKTSATSFKNNNKPYLLFIHGTNSATEGAFGELINNKAGGLWDFITSTYGENILAFDHKTLTQSALLNAQQLLELLPANSTFHLITHSRGGLVGDIIARADAANNTIGFTDAEIAAMEGRPADVACMKAIIAIAVKKRITVSKCIRVASPSMGTSLLSNRLDHYLNTLLNFIGLSTGQAANPIYIGTKTLLSEVASSKSNTDVLPGLEAMVPESPFIKILNNPANIINSPLVIIAGNCTIHLELKALLVILTKLYFRRKNDMVVDTWSMYFGTPRKTTVQFYLADEKGVDHIHYFRNNESQEAMKRALNSKEENIAGFKPLQAADISDASRNAALPFITSEVKYNIENVSGKKPVAIIIPGIMGSNLYKDDDRIWVDFWSFVKGDLIKLDINTPAITAPSLMGSAYKKLYNELSKQYDVVAFAFDWRQSLTDEAQKLDATIAFLLAKNQPIHVLAHSMGGVLFREFMLHGSNWAALNNSKQFRAIFLGAPLGGSYLIPETFTGRGGNINKLSMLDLKHGKKELLQVFANCPGLYNLLPLSNTPHNFEDKQLWQSLLSSSGNVGILPSDSMIKKFAAFKKHVLANAENLDYSNIFYIAGKADATTATFEINATGRANNLVFKSTPEGDGSVTWASGIPKKLIEKNQVYYAAKTTHGELGNDRNLFAAFIDLLKNGNTNLLRKTPPVSRGSNALVSNPTYEMLPVTANNVEQIVMGMELDEKVETTESLLKVSVSNGDLRDASFPLLNGHFYKDGILYAESVLDNYLNGVLRERHALNLYPGDVGTHEIILSMTTSPKGAVVVGLGELGELNGYKLELSVTQGVSKFLLRVRELEGSNPKAYKTIFKNGIGISALIVGCGFGGLSIDSSLRSIVMGVKKANENIKALNNPYLKKIEEIEFVELYEDRSLQAFYSLKRLESDQQLNIVLPANKINKMFGIKKRVPMDQQTDWWQRVSVEIVSGKHHNVLKFSASTGTAREELRNLNSNPKIIQHFIDQISAKNLWTEQLAKTIFELLIPNDFKDAVRNQYNILWRLDKNAAAFPWEMLQDTSVQSMPLCVTSGMIRQLATGDFRTSIKRSYKNNCLVIGDPDLKGFVYQLPGAAKEATAVASIAAAEGFTVTSKINTDFTEVIQALFQDEYKLIHLAGHGFFDPENPENAGMVIGDKLFLTSKEINQMSQVPEFVFVNCCYLGKVDGEAESKSHQRYQLAANIGVQLIEMGVKAVVAAGWAVDDNSALLFAEKFYEQMFEGRPFGEAVKEARSTCYKNNKKNNTWGAYQCYGDQFYTISSATQQKNKDKNYTLSIEIEIDLNNLSNKVEGGRHKKEDLLKDLEKTSKAIDKSGLRDGAITEMESRIYAALQVNEIAIEKMNSLLTLENACYSVKMLEDLFCLKTAMLRMETNKNSGDVIAAIKSFETLLKIGKTAERYLLLGQAYTVLALKLIEEAREKAEVISTNEKGKNKTSIKNDDEKLVAIKEAAGHFKTSYDIAKKNKKAELIALCNWLQTENLLILLHNKTEVKWGKQSINGYKLPSIKIAVEWMEKYLGTENQLQTFSKAADGVNAKAGVLLTRLCLEPSGKVNTTDITSLSVNTWSNGCLVVNNQLNTENLDFLQAVLTGEKTAATVALKKNIDFIKNKMNKKG